MTPPSRPDGSAEPLLSVRDLWVTFSVSGEEPFRAVDGVSFDVRPGQTVGLVGESGCGKSVTSLAIMGLLPKRGNTVEGTAVFDGEDLLSLSPAGDARPARPRHRDGLPGPAVLAQPGRHDRRPGHRGDGAAPGLSRKEATPQAADLLERVGIPDPKAAARRSTRTSSAAGCASARSSRWRWPANPRLLIADEPTTALDVTIQAQILALLKELVVDTGTALVMITHDLGVVAGLCDEVNVLYARHGSSSAAVGTVCSRTPRHPYTGGLLELDPAARRAARREAAPRSRAPSPTTCRGPRRARSRRAAPTRRTPAPATTPELGRRPGASGAPLLQPAGRPR